MADSQEFQRPLSSNINQSEPTGYSPFAQPEAGFPNPSAFSSSSAFPQTESAFGSDQSAVNPGINSPLETATAPAQSSGQETIPTLHVGRSPDENDATSYPDSSLTAKIFNQNKNSIVQVFGPSPSLPANEIYTGSGFFVDNRGDFATAYHVVKGLSKINVVTSDGTEYQGHIVSTRPTADLAIVSIGPDVKTQPVSLAPTSDSLKPGNSVDAVGHPQGWQNLYVSPGKFSGQSILGDVYESGSSGQNPQETLLDANINIQPGNSGSPVFNSLGKVIGVVDLGASNSQGNFVSVDDVWPMLPKPTDQNTKPDLPGFFPSKLHFSEPTAMLGLSAGALALTRIPKFSGAAVPAALFSGYLGATSLFNGDLSFLKTSLSHGSTKEKLSGAIDVGTDALMLGGAVLSITPWRQVGLDLGLAGAALKTADNIASYRSYS